jgi:hypothetical protein
MIDGSASIEPSVLLSFSAGAGLDAGKGEETWLSGSERDDETGMVKGSAWGESVVVREETRVASAGRDEEDGDSLEERTVTETVRVDVSAGERKEGREVSERGGCR